MISKTNVKNAAIFWHNIYIINMLKYDKNSLTKVYGNLNLKCCYGNVY